MCSCFLTSIYTAFVLSLVVHTSDCALSENERAVLGVGVGGERTMVKECEEAREMEEEENKREIHFILYT